MLAAVDELGYIWTGTIPPTCTVFVSPSSITAGGTGATLSWSTTNATSLAFPGTYGPVSPSQLPSASIGVNPPHTTTYSGTASGPGGSVACTAPSGKTYTLTVNPPTTPTATIAPDAASIHKGGSTTIRASFAAHSPDTLTADNIDGDASNPDVAYRGGLGASTNPDASKTITFTPSAEGTYTFYARATTGYYTSWTTYKSTTVTVLPPLYCTLDGVQVQDGQSRTFYSQTSAPTGTSCAAYGESRKCTNGVLDGDTAYSHATCACSTTPYCVDSSHQAGTGSSYNIIATRDSACTPTYQPVCATPAFCSAGSSSCLYPAPIFNQGSGFTGHLQVSPQLVHAGDTTTVHWDVTSVAGCTVSSAQNTSDTWTDYTSSTKTSAGSHTSSSINQQTTYTLHCDTLDGSPAVNESATVSVLPVFQER